jgi:hypothetical protein
MEQVQIKVTGFSRIMVSVLTPLGTFLFLTVFSMFSAFLVDLDWFDHLGLPRMSKNPYFNICSHVNCKQYGPVATKLTFNGLLAVAFWVHHILMANMNVKKVFKSILPGFGIYERALYIVSKY